MGNFGGEDLRYRYFGLQTRIDFETVPAGLAAVARVSPEAQRRLGMFEAGVAPELYRDMPSRLRWRKH
jgi:hypothetical protein